MADRKAVGRHWQLMAECSAVQPERLSALCVRSTLGTILKGTSAPRIYSWQQSTPSLALELLHPTDLRRIFPRQMGVVPRKGARHPHLTWDELRRLV